MSKDKKRKEEAPKKSFDNYDDDEAEFINEDDSDADSGIDLEYENEDGESEFRDIDGD